MGTSTLFLIVKRYIFAPLRVLEVLEYNPHMDNIRDFTKTLQLLYKLYNSSILFSSLYNSDSSNENIFILFSKNYINVNIFKQKSTCRHAT